MILPTAAGTRDVGDDDSDSSRSFIAPVGDRWAVIVGISRYHTSPLDLRYARRDAEQLHALLQTPEGGNYRADRMRLLVDENATSAAITKALRSFLLQAMPEDLILLYFACHGGPDQRRASGPLYLYSHDTDPADVAGTAVPMDDIDRSLSQIRAERIVITVDTCHSGGVGVATRTAGRAEATNRYLDALARSRSGVALLTSAEANEASEEDQKWGGGHGVFTHFLLEGMRGAADGFQGQRDGIVAVGELFEYVRHHVHQATNGRQHPAIGTSPFDRGLPMAITAELDVEQHLAIARGLRDIGWRLDDPAPFVLAARQFALAADLKRHLPSADADRGGCLLAAGRVEEAAGVLRSVTTMCPQEVAAGAWLHLGIAEAELNRHRAGAHALREYVRRDPSGDESAWATAYADWLEGFDRPGRRHVLLFGVGDFGRGRLSPLPGVASDLATMRKLFEDDAATDLRVLQDGAASPEAVLAELAVVGAEAGADDTIVVYFTGHSADRAGLDDPYLMTGEGDKNVIGITPRELVDALDLQVREVLLILDTHVTPALIHYATEKVAGGRLQILLACGVDEVAYELPFDDRPQGLFTHHLAKVLAAGGAATYAEAVATVKAGMAETLADRMRASVQQPRLIGSRSARLLGGRFPAADLWRVARRRTCRPDEVAGLRRLCAEVEAPLAMWALGRALLAARQADEGWRLLVKARNNLRSLSAELLLDLAFAALDRDDRANAADALRGLTATKDCPPPAHAALAALTDPASREPAVVVIGADSGYADVGAAQAAAGIAAALAAALGLAENDIQLITGAAATVDGIVAQAAEYARRSADQPVVVVLVGHTFGGGELTAASSYPRVHTRDGHLPLSDVLAKLGGCANALVILNLMVGADVPRDLARPALQTPAPELAFAGTLLIVAEATGRLTGHPLADLLTALPEAIGEGLTYRQWLGIDTEPPSREIFLHGDRQRHPVLTDVSATLLAQRHLAEARDATATAVAGHAQAEINRRAAASRSYPEGYLQLGLALEACGRLAEARSALRNARNLYDDDPVWSAEAGRDHAAAVDGRLQARYHYGRLLLTDEDKLDEAVPVLREALQSGAEDPRILRALGQAIRLVVERRSLVEAADYLVRYINQGAPLGFDTELASFLRQRLKSHAR